MSPLSKKISNGAAEHRADDESGVLVNASDGSDGALAALHVARLLAGRLACEVQILTVLDPVPVPARETMLLSAPPDLDADRRIALLAAVRRQASSVFGSDAPPVILEQGDPAVMITQFAESRRTSAIVLGLSRHGVLDRLIGGDTALEVVRLATVPVLAVAANERVLPGRVLVALDFSDASVRAARVAASIMREGASLVLAHVVPPDLGAVVGKPYEEGCAAAFRDVRRALGLEGSDRVETVVLRGTPARELLAFAPTVHADLIVAGREGTGAIRRFLVGSVATRLLRGAMCSVLVVPTTED